MSKVKLILNKIKEFWYWLTRLFSTRYTIVVSFDQQWGNADDQEYNHVRKVIKANFKELRFVTEDKRKVHIRGMAGLRYKIEEE